MWRDERGLALTLLLLAVLALVVAAVAWATARGTPKLGEAPPSRLASCSLLADTALLEGKGRLVRRMDALFRSGATFPGDEQALASGAIQGATYRVTARGHEVPAGTRLIDQPLTVTSRCRDQDGTEVQVTVEGHALTRSAFEIPFCACGDLSAGPSFSARFDSAPADDVTAPARLLLAANGSVRLATAKIAGGVIAGADLLGTGLPSGGSYAGGENALGGTAHVLPTPRPCRCDDTVPARELAVAAEPPAAAPVAPATAKSGRAAAAAATPPARAQGCARWLDGVALAVPAGETCELAGGRHALERLHLAATSTLRISAPVRLELSGAGPFEIAAGATLEVPAPGDLSIVARSDADLVLGATLVRSWVFAPRSRVTLADGSRFEGALAAGVLVLGQGVTLVADPHARTDALYVADLSEDTWRLEPDRTSAGPAPAAP
ncbi:MAG: hypothetical protein U0610_04840 [bacterium]